MYCDFCGAKLPDDSAFCSECGARLLPIMNNNLQPEPDDNRVKVTRISENVPDVPPMPGSPADKHQPAPPSSGQFTRAGTLTEAAKLAMQRNLENTWSYWDNPKRFFINSKSLLRDCEKEDREIASFDDHNGVQYYVVSSDGAIAQIYLDDNDENLILEWLYFTPLYSREKLPKTPEELQY